MRQGVVGQVLLREPAGNAADKARNADMRKADVWSVLFGTLCSAVRIRSS
jgi:hypothetical protein